MWVQIVVAILGSSALSAIVSAVINRVSERRRSKEARDNKEDKQNKALRYIMLYIIQERAKELIRRGSVTLDERRSLHHWHDLYHSGLGGNGDADALMGQVDHLPLEICKEEES